MAAREPHGMTRPEIEQRLVGAVLSAAEVTPEAGWKVLDRARAAGVTPPNVRPARPRRPLAAARARARRRTAARRPTSRRRARAGSPQPHGGLAGFVVDAAVTIAPPDRIVGVLHELSDGGTVTFSNAARIARQLVSGRRAEWAAAEPDIDLATEAA